MLLTRGNAFKRKSGSDGLRTVSSETNSLEEFSWDDEGEEHYEAELQREGKRSCLGQGDNLTADAGMRIGYEVITPSRFEMMTSPFGETSDVNKKLVLRKLHSPTVAEPKSPVELSLKHPDDCHHVDLELNYGLMGLWRSIAPQFQEQGHGHIQHAPNSTPLNTTKSTIDHGIVNTNMNMNGNDNRHYYEEFAFPPDEQDQELRTNTNTNLNFSSPSPYHWSHYYAESLYSPDTQHAIAAVRSTWDTDIASSVSANASANARSNARSNATAFASISDNIFHHPSPISFGLISQRQIHSDNNDNTSTESTVDVMSCTHDAILHMIDGDDNDNDNGNGNGSGDSDDDGTGTFEAAPAKSPHICMLDGGEPILGSIARAAESFWKLM